MIPAIVPTADEAQVRVEVVERMVEMLNRDLIPAVPEQGSLGASGDEPAGVYPCAGDDVWLALSCGTDAETFGKQLGEIKAREAADGTGPAPSRRSGVMLTPL